MLISFDVVMGWNPPKDKPLTTRVVYMNPTYIISLAQETAGRYKGFEVCCLVMASRGDVEEGNDSYYVQGVAYHLQQYINDHHAAVAS